MHLALDAIGIKEGDEVLVPTMTFTATAEVVLYFKARPVLIDCQPDTLNIDPDKIEEKITARTKAIIPVHLAGQACEMDRILEIARKHNLKVIEDAAHALPARYREKMIGTVGDSYLLFVLCDENNDNRRRRHGNHRQSGVGGPHAHNESPWHQPGCLESVHQ